MRILDLRERLLLAALAPVSLVGLLLSSLFLLARFDAIEQAYQQRIQWQIRQLAQASEFAFFSGNTRQLRALAQGTLRESEAVWVTFQDRAGVPLASAGEERGPAPLAQVPGALVDTRRHEDWLGALVLTGATELESAYEGVEAAPSSANSVLGRVLVRFSHRGVDLQKRNMLLLGLGVSLLGLALGLLLALRLSRDVLRPIGRVTDLLERIGRGDFSAATPLPEALSGKDPLRTLQVQLQVMAQRLLFARDELEQQVQAATQTIREKKDEAEQANLAKSRFLATASHDLRQPVHALGMFVARLAQLPHQAATRQLVTHLEESVQAMQQLLDSLLDVSRLEAGSVPVKLVPIALRALFQQVINDVAELADKKGLRLRLRGAPLWVLSDATLLYRILLNLLSNAVRYTERGGVLLAARCSPDAAQVRVEVWDTGVGIAPQHQQAVFMEFVQLSNPGRERQQGLGLGLNIVQRAAALLGHPLQLSSKLGRGSRLRLTLPRAAPPLLAPPGVSSSPVKLDRLQGAAVLVVEDDALVRAALHALLSGWGMQVALASGLDAARAQLDAGLTVQLIVCDYRLADGYNGIEVIDLVRGRLGATLAACLVSGDIDDALTRAAEQAGLTLLHKPLRPAKLRSLLHHLLTASAESDLAH